MFAKAYQLTATSYANLSLGIHERINDLHRRAEGLAYRVANSAADSGCTDQTAASYAKLGPRQRRAWDIIAEALAWNALSDRTPEAEAELAKAEQAERDGVAYEVVGVWGDEGHVYQVRLDAQDAIVASAARHGHATTCTEHGGRDLAACDPADCDEAALAASFSVTVFDSHPGADPVQVPAFVADPTKPTDAELAAAIQRGLATGQLVDATDWLAAQRAQRAQDAQDAQPDVTEPGTQLIRCKGCGYTWEVPGHADSSSRLCSVCFQVGRYCFAAPVPADQVAAALPGIAWLDHDNLCQLYRSQGVMACTCSPVCRCRACQAKAQRSAQVAQVPQATRGHFHDTEGLTGYCTDSTCSRVSA